ncbi:flagella basal body P-ring formation protein FlgA [Alicyclobacillus fodiniaquatilis]|uniref:Flagella basal body P-ring formation protein FlgA n=1 Tax=Alicyclobacillus fodiniaquatilis TaxID=1661150 RepID=A0ABW4JFP5_9BACL
MKPRVKQWFKYGAATVVFLIGCGGTIAYTNWIRPVLNDQEVWFATKTLTPNAMIQASELTHGYMDKDHIPEGSVLDENQIVGKRASVTIPENGIITNSNLETDSLALTKGTQDFQVSSDWIASIEDTLRRGDHVDIYLLPSDQETMTTGSNGAGHKTAAINAAMQSPPYLKNIPVEWVHNDSNQEVVNNSAQGTGDLGSPENGTAVPSKLELKLTNNQVSELVTAIKAQNKLIISYLPTVSS